MNFLRQNIPLFRFVPQIFGGENYNVWNELFEKYVDLPRNRAALWDFVKHHRCKTILEIGLGSGHNMEKMLSLAGDGCCYYCFDNLNELHSQRAFHKLKNRKNVYFYIGDTKKILSKVISELPKMDLIFIDGGHSYETCKSDWENCKQLMHDNTAVFFHDYLELAIKRTVDEIGNKFSVKIVDSDVRGCCALVKRLS